MKRRLALWMRRTANRLDPAPALRVVARDNASVALAAIKVDGDEIVRAILKRQLRRGGGSLGL